MNLGDCGRTITLWLFSDKYWGALMKGESHGAKCPYPESRDSLSISLGENGTLNETKWISMEE